MFETLREILDRHHYRYISMIPADMDVAFSRNECGLLTLLSSYRQRTTLLFSYSRLRRLIEYSIKCLKPETYLLYQLFFRGLVVRPDLVEPLLDGVLTELLDASLLFKVGFDGYRARQCIVPFKNYYLFCDFPISHQDHVYLGATSCFMAQYLLSHSWPAHGRGLDIGSGSGILTFMLRRFCREVVGIDISDEATTTASLNRTFNNISGVQFITDDFNQFQETGFDFIVGNPPAADLPSSFQGVRNAYGGKYGIEKTIKVIRYIEKALHENGQALLLTGAPVVQGENILYSSLRDLVKESGLSIAVEVQAFWPMARVDWHEPEFSPTHKYLVLLHIRRNARPEVILRPLPFYRRLEYIFQGLGGSR